MNSAGVHPVQDREADGADQQHRDADRHAQRQQNQHDDDADQADHLRDHYGFLGRLSAAQGD
jgi:hypothetical protein